MATLTVTICRHAVVRFQDRVRPALSFAAAEEEIVRLLMVAQFELESPAWLRAAQPADGYLVIGDLVFPVRRIGSSAENYAATTCIPRGSISEPTRQRRTSQKSRRPRATTAVSDRTACGSSHNQRGRRIRTRRRQRPPAEQAV